MITIKVKQFFEEQQDAIKLDCLSGQTGFARSISVPQIQRLGLALTGDTAGLQAGRIQVLGNSEMRFLRKMAPARRKTVLRKICQAKVPGLIVTNNNAIPKDLKEICTKQKTALFKSRLPTPSVVKRTQEYLGSLITKTTSLHGVLVEVTGIGVLLMGKSGIGKSECALELIMRGHRLVADDIVNIKLKAPSSLSGSSSELIKYHLEVRGLGILNIKDLFGVAAVRDQKVIELVIDLVEWNPGKEYERVGITERNYKILGIDTPFLRIPVRPGRSLATIIEVAARNQLLKIKGYHAAQQFQDRLTAELLAGTITNKM